MILATVFPQNSKVQQKGDFRAKWPIFFLASTAPKKGGGPPTRVLSKNIKNPEIWPILGYFGLLWAGPAKHCCTPVYLPIEDFRQKLPFSWDSLAPKYGWGGSSHPSFLPNHQKPWNSAYFEYFGLLWVGAAEQCCTPAYLYSIV